jgi:hypothetical protein
MRSIQNSRVTDTRSMPSRRSARRNFHVVLMDFFYRKNAAATLIPDSCSPMLSL